MTVPIVPQHLSPKAFEGLVKTLARDTLPLVVVLGGCTTWRFAKVLKSRGVFVVYTTQVRPRYFNAFQISAEVSQQPFS